MHPNSRPRRPRDRKIAGLPRTRRRCSLADRDVSCARVWDPLAWGAFSFENGASGGQLLTGGIASANKGRDPPGGVSVSLGKSSGISSRIPCVTNSKHPPQADLLHPQRKLNRVSQLHHEVITSWTAKGPLSRDTHLCPAPPQPPVLHTPSPPRSAALGGSRGSALAGGSFWAVSRVGRLGPVGRAGACLVHLRPVGLVRDAVCASRAHPRRWGFGLGVGGSAGEMNHARLFFFF